MKNLIHLFILSCLFITCTQSNDSYKEQLEQHKALITVKAINEAGHSIQDAQIKFYGYGDDLYNRRNQVGVTKYTDSNGFVTFGWDELGKNYILVESDCLNNYTNGTVVNISPRVNNLFTAILKETGTLTVQSTSSNAYRIYIDGEPKMDLPGKESITWRYCEAKYTTVRVQQLEGYIFPTDKTYNLNIQCGGSFNVTYP